MFAALGARRIVAYSSARFLIHQPAGYAIGTAEELRRDAQHLDRLVQSVAKELQRRTGQGLDRVYDWLSTDTYFTANEALHFGLIDAIIAEPKRPAIDGEKALTPGVNDSDDGSERLFRTLLNAYQPWLRE